MTIKLLDSAKRDLKRGFRFYEDQAVGLGDYFLDSIFSDIDSLLLYHGIHPIRFNEYHYMFSKRFPFAIYYTVEDENIYVNAILDCRQDPQKADTRFSDT